jgi:hypothetical protein
MDSHFKRFHAIRKIFFPHKTTQAVVEYYYFWKVTTDTETQKDFDEVSSQSEEFDDLALHTSNSHVTKRKRDALLEPFPEDALGPNGWGNFDAIRRSSDFVTRDDGPPLKRSKSDDFRLSTDSFFAREEDGLDHSQVEVPSQHLFTF